jgi:hypothetical protein
MGTPCHEAAPARRLAAVAAAVELTASELMTRRHGLVVEPYEQGRPGALLKASKALTVGGVATSLVGARSRVLSTLGGAMLTSASVLTRFGIFQAGLASAKDPKYVVAPQRERAERRTLAG